jgi:hypothetical protein
VELGIAEAPRNKRKAIEKNAAMKLMEDVHCDFIEEIVRCDEEIVRRERIDQEETIMVAEEEDDWTTEGESSDEEEEDNSNN